MSFLLVNGDAVHVWNASENGFFFLEVPSDEATTQDITGAMWDSWGRGDLDLLKSMGVNTCLGEIDRKIATFLVRFFGLNLKDLTNWKRYKSNFSTQASHVWQ